MGHFDGGVGKRIDIACLFRYPCHQFHQSHANHHAHITEDDRNHHRLGQHQCDDMACLRTYSPSDAHLTCPLLDGNQHDVRHADHARHERSQTHYGNKDGEYVHDVTDQHWAFVAIVNLDSFLVGRREILPGGQVTNHMCVELSVQVGSGQEGSLQEQVAQFSVGAPYPLDRAQRGDDGARAVGGQHRLIDTDNLETDTIEQEFLSHRHRCVVSEEHIFQHLGYHTHLALLHHVEVVDVAPRHDADVRSYGIARRIAIDHRVDIFLATAGLHSMAHHRNGLRHRVAK